MASPRLLTPIAATLLVCVILSPLAEAAQIKGNVLQRAPGETDDRAQSNEYVTVISRPDGSVQVFYHDANSGNKLVNKTVAAGQSLQISYWDMNSKMQKQQICGRGGVPQAESLAAAPKAQAVQKQAPVKAESSSSTPTALSAAGLSKPGLSAASLAKAAGKSKAPVSNPVSEPDPSPVSESVSSPAVSSPAASSPVAASASSLAVSSPVAASASSPAESSPVAASASSLAVSSPVAASASSLAVSSPVAASSSSPAESSPVSESASSFAASSPVTPVAELAAAASSTETPPKSALAIPSSPVVLPTFGGSKPADSSEPVAETAAATPVAAPPVTPVRPVQGLKAMSMPSMATPSVSSIPAPAASSFPKPTSTDNYCSTVDTDLGPCAWKKFPIKVFLPPAPVSYGPQLVADVRGGFDTWSKVTGGNISFQYVGTAKEADMVVGWAASQKEFRNPSEAGEYNASSGSTGVGKRTLKNPASIKHVTLKFALRDINNNPWSAGGLRSTALHEIGHSLGLAGHSPNAGDIMYAVKSSVSELSERDLNTLKVLYGPVFDGTATD